MLPQRAFRFSRPPAVEWVNSLALPTFLASLDLPFCRDVTHEGLLSLPHLTSLTQLRIRFSDPYTDEGLITA